MKLEHLKPFFGALVTIQLKVEWWGMAFQGTVVAKRPGDPAGHICQVAMRQAMNETGQVGAAPVGPIGVIGPVMLNEEDGVLVITQSGMDGSTLKTGCDPDDIAFVNLCVAPPPEPKKIVLP
jgi:hypothetical protein